MPNNFELADEEYYPESERTVLTIPEDLPQIEDVGVAELSRDHTIQFGDRSILRRVLPDLRNVQTIWTAGFEQAMHPVIGDALMQQSAVSREGGNLWGRFDRSASYIGAIVVNNDAVAAGRRVRDFHRHVQGRDTDGAMVSAIHPEPYTWGWATIVGMTERAIQQTYGAKPTPQGWERWWQEARIAFQCQRVSDRLLPKTYEEYRAYYKEMLDTRLTRTEAFEEGLDLMTSGEIHRPPQVPPLFWNKPVRQLFSQYVRVVGVGGLHEDLRQRLDIPWSRADQVAYEGLMRGTKLAWPYVPARMGYHPDSAPVIHPARHVHHTWQMRFQSALWGLSFEGGTSAPTTATPHTAEHTQQ